jgi:hypothetical protein
LSCRIFRQIVSELQALQINLKIFGFTYLAKLTSVGATNEGPTLTRLRVEGQEWQGQLYRPSRAQLGKTTVLPQAGARVRPYTWLLN